MILTEDDKLLSGLATQMLLLGGQQHISVPYNNARSGAARVTRTISGRTLAWRHRHLLDNPGGKDKYL